MDLFSTIADSLSQTDFLSGIDAKFHSSIFHRGDRIDVQPSETVFFQGDPARKCYFLLAGLIKLTKFHEQGKAVVVRFIKPGELTAAIAVFKENLYPVTAEAVSHSELVGWDKQGMVALMAEYPQLAVNMLGVAFDRLQDLQTRYLELFAEQVEQRIARALLRIMRQSGRKTNEGILIDFPLSRQGLADYTGTTVYTVSRVLSAWEKKGWVISRRERITVSDPHALVLFTENR